MRFVKLRILNILKVYLKRTYFFSCRTEGLIGLVNEIKMEIERISARNLGRDDRVISDHSRESRFPFLDEDVVSFLNPIPVTQKVALIDLGLMQ